MTDLSGPPRATLLFLLASALLGSMGIGLLGPVLPFIVGEQVRGSAAVASALGLLGASYALCAFFAAPALGALSDAWARRPVLLLSLAGSVAGYLVFGWGGALWALFLGRVLDGLTAGTFGALFGMLADVTAPEARGRTFGLLGATFGAGFILGPALGGVLSHFGLNAPVYAAAALSALSLLWGLFLVPESLPVARRDRGLKAARLNPFNQIAALFALPGLRPLLTVGALFSLAFALSTSTLSLLAKDLLRWGPAQTGTVLIAVGLCDIVAQGLLLGPLLRRFGERRVALGGLTSSALGLVGMALLTVWPAPALLYSAVALFAAGEGMFTASLGALLSVVAGPEAQGRVQGGGQALQALASVAGPLGGGQLYARAGAATPAGLGAGLVALAALLTGFARRRGEVAPDELSA